MKSENWERALQLAAAATVIPGAWLGQRQPQLEELETEE